MHVILYYDNYNFIRLMNYSWRIIIKKLIWILLMREYKDYILYGMITLNKYKVHFKIIKLFLPF